MLHISTIAVRLHICIRNLNQICISNSALSQTIYLVPWSCSTWSKQKILAISNLCISNFCLCQTNFPLSIFLSLSQNSTTFPKFPMLFADFSLFSSPAGTIAMVVLAKICKDTQIDFFCSFFIKYLDSIF